MPPRLATRGCTRSSGTRGNFLNSGSNCVQTRGSVTQKSAAAVVSQTLIDLRKRILDDIKGTKKELNKLFQSCRKQTWEVAFGQQGGGDDVEVSTIEISLICPYSRTALRHPVRSRDCKHLQCCDLESWISLLNKYRSMRDPTAPCPVCERRVAASSLEIDYWQLHVLSQMPANTHMLILDSDGSYRSGDVSRDEKKQQLTELIDGTQVQSESDNNLSLDLSPDPVFSTPVMSSASVARVKRERVSEDFPEPFSSEFPSVSTSLTHDEDVVVVHYIDRMRRVRELPSQLRLWVAHCPLCTAALLKNETGEIESCAQCGTGRKDWTLVRSFPGSHVSLELTADGTLIVRGADALAPYLMRAGFFCAVFLQNSEGCLLRAEAGLWYTTIALTRYELDFLEACCQRLASGEAIDDMPSVPPLFRIPRRRLVRREVTSTTFSHSGVVR